MTAAEATPSGAPPSSGGPLVVLDHVNKWFGDLHVLQDIDLEVASKEFALNGLSGARIDEIAAHAGVTVKLDEVRLVVVELAREQLTTDK